MDLLDGAPRVTVVASSRHPLHVQAEHEHPVPPLRLPTATGRESAAMSGAVQMFVQYAQLVRPGLQLDDENCGEIAAICQRLDGLPLALKLAAARCKMLSPKAVLGAARKRPGHRGARQLRARAPPNPARHDRLVIRSCSMSASSGSSASSAYSPAVRIWTPSRP